LNETVIWKAVWRATPAGTAVDHDTAITVTGTHTETDDPGTDKELIRTAIVIDYDATNQVIDKGDWINVVFSRDVSTDTYGGETPAAAVVVGFELQYTKALAPLSVSEGSGDGPYLERVNGATDPVFRVVWPAGDVTPIQLSPVLLPGDLDGTQDAVIRLRAQVSSTNDTPVIAVGAYQDVGDTNFGGNTGALSDTLASVTRTLDAGDISDTPEGRAVTFLLTPGAHNTDAVRLYGAQLDYTSTSTPDALALADLAADADTEISFEILTDECSSPVR
jgi:hypothetical protein